MEKKLKNEKVVETKIRSATGTIATTLFMSPQHHAVLIIASATGVTQSFYGRFAEFMATRGITVITFDYFGIGKSLEGSIVKLTNCLEDWGTNDLESVITYAIDNFPASKKYLIGHSIGGQLVGLAKSSTKLDKIILLAAQSGYWKFWPGFSKIKMWANWHILIPLLTNMFGYLPSKKISSMENLPKNVAKQWSSWGKRHNYLFSDLHPEQTVFKKIKAEITAISIDGDEFAPKHAVDWMASQFGSEKLKRVHWEPKDFKHEKICHFGAFKEKYKDNIWPLLLNELT
jgi:predicted alpha/beta hydrolase